MDYRSMYDAAFSNPTYNIRNESEISVNLSMRAAMKTDCKTIIDVGSGRGVFLKEIHNIKNDVKIVSLDLNNYHNLDFVEFHKFNFSNCETFEIKEKYDLLTCMDVLEHVDKLIIEESIRFLSKLAKTAVLGIANHSDIIDGVELHLIQENAEWWTELLSKYFTIDAMVPYYSGRLYVFNVTPKDAV